MAWTCYRLHLELLLFFFFKQKTAYEMRISDWSSDVCSSDLQYRQRQQGAQRDDPRQHVANGLGVRAGKPLAYAQFGQQHAQCLGLAVDRDQHGQGKEQRTGRSEERRGGKECVSTCRSRWSQCL